MRNPVFKRLSEMRCLIISLLLFFNTILKAQKFDFPQLPAQVANISSVIPPNWRAIDTVYGDLNHDQLPDLVLALEYVAPVSELRAYGDADTEIIKEFQKPRILAIYFKRKNGYSFALQNNDFLLRDKEGGIYGDPYDGISIKNNVLNLSFRGGSNWRWKLDYQFQYTHETWQLINAKNLYYHNSSGEMEEKNYDFLNRQVTEVAGNLHIENSGKTQVRALNFGKVRTFNTFKKPWTWEIRKDEFL